MSKRFLNVEYENTAARIDIKNMEDICQVQKAVEEWYSKDFPQVTALRVQLWNKTASESKQIKTWSQLKGLPRAYFAEEGGISLTVQLLPPQAQTGMMCNRITIYSFHFFESRKEENFARSAAI